MTKPDTASLIAESIEVLERVGCQFFACDGPTLEPVPMCTCFVCDLLARLRVAIGQPPRRDHEMTAEERIESERVSYMATTRSRS